MPANVENMFSAREIPWHKIGEVTEGALSSKEAIVKAGLDWTVSTRPIATFESPDIPARIDNLIPVEDFWATVRDTDDSVLGVVGNRYTPIQNL